MFCSFSIVAELFKFIIKAMIVKRIIIADAMVLYFMGYDFLNYGDFFSI